MRLFEQLILVMIIILIVLPASVRAAGLEYLGIEAVIEGMDTSNTLTLKFAEPVTHWDYRPDFKPQELVVESNFVSNCTVKGVGDRSVISCDFSEMGEDNLLKLKFRIAGGVKKSDSRYHFDVRYGVSLPVGRIFAIIKLPEGGALASEQANMSYFPASGETMTDGRHIMVYWEKINVSADDPLQFSVRYTMPETVSSTLVVAVAAIIIITVVGVGVYIRQSHKHRVVTSVLNEDERAIVNLLTKYGGRAVQKVLVRETDFSKAKVSRLVKNLKARGVVDVEPVSGRENRVILKIRSE